MFKYPWISLSVTQFGVFIKLTISKNWMTSEMGTMHNIPSKLYGNNSYKIFFDCRVNLMNDLSQTKSLSKQANGTTANCMDQHEAYAGSVVSNIDYRSMFRHLITFCYQRACSSWIYLLMYLKSQ